jgi:adenylate kinase
MADRYKTILFFGGPGSGKGTQGKIIGSIPGFHHVATGDIFRSLDQTSELGKLFLSYSTQGLLVPDDVTVRIWSQAMRAKIAQGLYNPGTTLLILDGIPRTVAQARMMEQHIDVLRIVHLVCRDPEALFERMRRRAIKENRPDDADNAVIRKRWEVYQNETYPELACYGQNLIAEVDCLATIGRVLHDVLGVLVPIQEREFAGG